MSPHSLPPPGYYPFRVGELHCVALSDGFIPGTVAILASEVDPEEVVEFLRLRGRQPEGLRVQLSCLLVTDPGAGRTILIDTGIGQMPGPAGVPLATAGKLVHNLRAAGVDPVDVDAVLISHLHVDHVGGAFDTNDRPVFPNATFFVGEEQVDFYSADNPDLSGTLAPPAFRQKSVEVAKRFLRLAEPQTTIFGNAGPVVPGITPVPVPGHSPGQVGFLIERGEDSLLYTADAFGDPMVSIERPHWRFFGDADSPTAVATRRRLVEELREQRQRFFTPHFPWPNLGRIGTAGGHPAWTPEPYHWDHWEE